MEFNPAIHTKEFLLNNSKDVMELAKYSVEFSTSALASDLELISLVISGLGFTAAHYLAECQPEWLQSDASKSPEILRLASKSGFTVAHCLARFQTEWLHSEASKSTGILRLANNNGYTVAHWLAECQPRWLQSDASKSPEILLLADEDGVTVAHWLAQHQPEWLQSDASKSPDILRLASNDGLTVAHWLARHQPEWLHNVGDSLLNQCKALIEDNLDVQISLKQLMALYSTFHHNISKIVSTGQQKSVEQWHGLQSLPLWQELLVKSENMIRQHLNNNPSLYDIDHTVDIFCEPADDLLKQLQSERHLSAIQYSIDTTDIEPIMQAIY
jgi:hypothetical protein